MNPRPETAAAVKRAIDTIPPVINREFAMPSANQWSANPGAGPLVVFVDEDGHGLVLWRCDVAAGWSVSSMRLPRGHVTAGGGREWPTGATATLIQTVHGDGEVSGSGVAGHAASGPGVLEMLSRWIVAAVDYRLHVLSVMTPDKILDMANLVTCAGAARHRREPLPRTIDGVEFSGVPVVLHATPRGLVLVGDRVKVGGTETWELAGLHLFGGGRGDWLFPERVRAGQVMHVSGATRSDGEMARVTTTRSLSSSVGPGLVDVFLSWMYEVYAEGRWRVTADDATAEDTGDPTDVRSPKYLMTVRDLAELAGHVCDDLCKFAIRRGLVPFTGAAS